METRMATLEWAANTLELARAVPWVDLSPQWAEKQKLPHDLLQRMNQPIAVVKIQTDSQRPNLKQIIVEVRWKLVNGAGEMPVVLSTYLATRGTS